MGSASQPSVGSRGFRVCVACLACLDRPWLLVLGSRSVPVPWSGSHASVTWTENEGPSTSDEGYKQLLRRGLEFTRREKGDDHDETLAHLTALAVHLHSMGKLDEARQVAEERDQLAARRDSRED